MRGKSVGLNYTVENKMNKTTLPDWLCSRTLKLKYCLKQLKYEIRNYISAVYLNFLRGIIKFQPENDKFWRHITLSLTDDCQTLDNCPLISSSPMLNKFKSHNFIINLNKVLFYYTSVSDKSPVMMQRTPNEISTLVI